MQLPNHELQVIVTVTLLALAAIAALAADFLRIRTMRRDAGLIQAKSGAFDVHVLVPELSAPAATNGRASRLATALKQPRRELSPAAKAAIERGAQLATPRKNVAASEPGRQLQQVG